MSLLRFSFPLKAPLLKGSHKTGRGGHRTLDRPSVIMPSDDATVFLFRAASIDVLEIFSF